MMNIHHIALRVRNLDKMKSFYIKYFGMQSGPLYQNPAKGFSSYFLSFGQGTQIELIHRESNHEPFIPDPDSSAGFIHIALSVESREEVNRLTEQLRNDGYTIAGEPRETGDGYYESVVLDPEENWVEIME